MRVTAAARTRQLLQALGKNKNSMMPSQETGKLWPTSAIVRPSEPSQEPRRAAKLPNGSTTIKAMPGPTALS